MPAPKTTVITPNPGFQQRFVCSNVDFVIGGGAMASGKCQPLDSRVLTPSGWRLMGDIKPGDQVMTPFDGPARVLAVYPQGVKDIYRLTTSDGRSCECSPDHLWTIRTTKHSLRTVATMDIIQLLINDYSVYVPVADISTFPLDLAIEYSRFLESKGLRSAETETVILSVEKVRQAECQCILIDNDKHLYVTDDYIATHNTYGALLMAASHIADPNFRMVFIRRYTGDVKAGGGGIDEASKIYGPIAAIRQSENPRLSFPSGAFIDFTHMSDQKEDNVLERVKGWQYSCIYVDEATAHEWSTIRILMGRNRSQAKWSGKFRVTCNPKRRSWLRYWVDWYVDDEGYPIPERDGIVRYFYVNGKDITDVVLGDTPYEVYQRCSDKIDSILQKLNSAGDGDLYTYRDLIKSYTYYAGNMAENRPLMKGNSGYAGSVAAMGEKQAQANMLGCWNVDDEDDNTPIKRSEAQTIADNPPQRNGSRWITCDLADTGTDNCVLVAWDGLHVIDFHVIQKSTPALNCRAIEHFAARNEVGEAHIIYDAVRAAYMLDYFPSAVPYVSYKPAIGLYKRIGERLKDILYLRLVECVNNGRLSIDPAVANLPYEHTSRRTIPFAEEFVRECAVVNFTTTVTGKRRLWTKKEMKAALGSGLSPDLLDCMVARFLPLCDYEYGEELLSAPGRRQSPDDSLADFAPTTIYDDSLWF